MLIIWIRAVSLYKQHIHTHSFLNSERMKFAKSLSFSLLAKKEFTAGSIHSFFCTHMALLATLSWTTIMR